jgi:hypothetical protein
MKSDEKKESINHPTHYGGQQNPYEAIKIIEALDLGFCLGNTVKYISRAGKKDPTKQLEDLSKARWYLDREIQKLEHKALGEQIIKTTKKVTSKK